MVEVKKLPDYPKDVRVHNRPLQCSHHIGYFCPSGRTRADVNKKLCERRAWVAHNCLRKANVIINGRPLCTLHAGEAALALLLENEGENNFG